MSQRITDNRYRTTLICIDSYDDSVLNGKFFNLYEDTSKNFRSTIEFLSEMEQTLDNMDFPRSFSAVRTFSQPTEQETGPPDTQIRRGNMATFAVKILFRQNASWQGSITWLEGKMEQSFRSVLELILLMDSALSSQKVIQQAV